MNLVEPNLNVDKHQVECPMCGAAYPFKFPIEAGDLNSVFALVRKEHANCKGRKRPSKAKKAAS